MEYTAVVKRCGEWWIGWIEEVPGVNCQERTHEELRQSPRCCSCGSARVQSAGRSGRGR